MLKADFLDEFDSWQDNAVIYWFAVKGVINGRIINGTFGKRVKGSQAIFIDEYHQPLPRGDLLKNIKLVIDNNSTS